MQRAIFTIAFLLSLASLADVPTVLGYQGRVVRADGTPETGIATLRFALFDAASGGTNVGCEVHTLGLSDGYYALFLGTGNTCGGAGPAWSTDVIDGRDLYLELTVNGSTLTPRQRVGSVAYALRASTATTALSLDGGTVNALSVSVGGTQVIDSSGHLVGPAALSGSAPIGLSGGVVSLQGCSIAGQSLVWSGSAWACASGSVTAAAPLSVNGGVVSLQGCAAAGQSLVWDGGAWGCGTPVGTISGGSCGTNGLMTGVSPTGTPLCAHLTNSGCDSASPCTPTCTDGGTRIGNTVCLIDNTGRNLCSALCLLP